MVTDGNEMKRQAFIEKLRLQHAEAVSRQANFFLVADALLIAALGVNLGGIIGDSVRIWISFIGVILNIFWLIEGSRLVASQRWIARQREGFEGSYIYKVSEERKRWREQSEVYCYTHQEYLGHARIMNFWTPFIFFAFWWWMQVTLVWKTIMGWKWVCGLGLILIGGIFYRWIKKRKCKKKQPSIGKTYCRVLSRWGWLILIAYVLTACASMWHVTRPFFRASRSVIGPIVGVITGLVCWFFWFLPQWDRAELRVE